MLKRIYNFFKKETTEQLAYDYLSNSQSLEDLERRQRLINRGEAPWQQKANNNLRGWV